MPRTYADQPRRRTTASAPAADAWKRAREAGDDPDGRSERPRPRIDSALMKALARAQPWRRLLECGDCASITELAAAEKIDRSYLCRVLRLTLLAPEIVEAIMDGRQAEGVTLPALMKGCPVEWEKQPLELVTSRVLRRNADRDPGSRHRRRGSNTFRR